jgi:hypothetical protein
VAIAGKLASADGAKEILPKPFFTERRGNGDSLRKVDELNAIEKADGLAFHFPQ